MDLDKAIRALYEEKRRLDALIASLEETARHGDLTPHRPAQKRRGRKGMSPEERLIVSERMKKYWADRKRQEQAART